MRLIDADELLKALSKFDDYEYGNWYFLDGIETATKIVNDAPTVEPNCPICGARTSCGYIRVAKDGIYFSEDGEHHKKVDWSVLPPLIIDVE